MFGMSVNEVPGWLVAMAPSGIGVPVAATPGLVPQLDVLTVAALAELDEPAAGVDPVARCCCYCCCSRPRPGRERRRAGSFFARTYVFSSVPLRAVSLSQFTVTTILMASGGLLIANSNASAARASGKWCEKTWARAARLAATRRIACGEILGRRAARAEDVYFLFREGARPQRRRSRGQADDHDPAGRRRHLDRLGQHAGLAAGLDDERRPLAAGPLAGLRGQVVRRSPGHDLGAEALGQVAAAGQRVDRQHPRAGVDGRDQRGQADRAGAEHHHLLAGPAGRGPARARPPRRARRSTRCPGPGRRPRRPGRPGPRAVRPGRRRGARRPGGRPGRRWAARRGTG